MDGFFFKADVQDQHCWLNCVPIKVFLSCAWRGVKTTHLCRSVVCAQPNYVRGHGCTACFTSGTLFSNTFVVVTRGGTVCHYAGGESIASVHQRLLCRTMCKRNDICNFLSWLKNMLHLHILYGSVLCCAIWCIFVITLAF